jgi:hypothetical protein
MEVRAPQFLPVLGPQVDTKFWEQIFGAGAGPVTSVPAETVAIMMLRQTPSPFTVANGRNIHVAHDNPAMIEPNR